MRIFSNNDLSGFWKPDNDSRGEDNGQVTIIGGSSLFQGAPLMSLVAASRLVDMLFIATPEEDKEIVEKMALFSKLRSVIWIPREELDNYIEKSDAVLVGNGLMRYHGEKSKIENQKSNFDSTGAYTRHLTERLLKKFPEKKWVIDGGSLQTMDAEWIPKGSVLTPNYREYRMLFNEDFSIEGFEKIALKYNCVLVHKGPVGYITNGEVTYQINGGNAGLTKGGTGDVLAGIIVGLLAKNDGLLAAAAGSFLLKKTAEVLSEKVGYNYNADDVAEKVFEVRKSLE